MARPAVYSPPRCSANRLADSSANPNRPADFSANPNRPADFSANPRPSGIFVAPNGHRSAGNVPMAD